MEIKRFEFNPKALPEIILNNYKSLLGSPKDEKRIDLAHFYPFSQKIKLSENEENYDCYLNKSDYTAFENKIRNKELFALDGTAINLKTVQPYILSYAKGFSKGYSEYLNKCKMTELFDLDNTDYEYRVFKRVYGDVQKGCINAVNFKFNDLGSINDSEYIHNISVMEYIDEKLMFEEGILGGEFYKAWEVILLNPIRFEKYFIDKKPQELPKTSTNKLTTKLTHDQLKSLFDQLKTPENGFIDPGTKEYNFLHVFGEPLPDGKGFERVKWLKNVQLLRELLNPIRCNEIRVVDMERIVPSMFIKDGNPLKMAKDKKVPSFDSDKIEAIIKKISD